MGDFADAIATMRRFAYSRDRAIDREPRQIVLTDDQAVAVLAALAPLAEETTTNDP